MFRKKIGKVKKNEDWGEKVSGGKNKEDEGKEAKKDDKNKDRLRKTSERTQLRR